MFNKKKALLITLLAVVVVVSSSFLGYYFIKPTVDSERNPNEMIMNKIYPIVTTKVDTQNKDIREFARITPDTTIQYNYKKNGEVTKTLTEKASDSIINLTEEELKNTLNDVKVVDFSKDLVILEKNSDNKKSSYIVGSNNGFVSIFYKDEDENITLYNETDIIVDTLPEQDKKLLEKGISAKDNAELIKIIEDYTS